MQLGLTNSDAENALAIGARMLAHGFNDWEIGHMIHTQYRFRADLERGYDQGVITPSDFRKLREIRGW